ncbi:MAG: DUF427 domain-containing protein [Proteobacteria bacterium]|nr:DUF427 domain-containing protein [Pseudomonadota bacterium]
MTARTVKQPSAEHPISVTPATSRIVIKIAGRTLADTREALTLREAAYPPVHYIPRKDVDMSLLQRSPTTTYCPYKGDCSYFSVPVGGSRSIDAIWTYEQPYPAVAAIKDHIAVYPSRVDSIEERPLD